MELDGGGRRICEEMDGGGETVIRIYCVTFQLKTKEAT